MRAALLLVTAVTIGLAGGYVWSSITPSGGPASGHAKASMVVIPASPEEQPGASDQEWAGRADGQKPLVTAGNGSVDRSVHYSGCNEVRAAGKAPLYSSDPGYREGMDGDGDGIACEPIRN